MAGTDPSDLSWWLGGPQYNTNPNNAKMQDAGYQRGIIQNALGQLNPGQPASFDTSGSDYWRGQQQGLANQLGQIASGQQAGAGELAVNRQIGSAIAAQRSAANSARGANGMLAAREAARQSANLGVNGAGLGQQAALQDQTAARQELAGVLGQGRQQDLTSSMGKLQAMGMNQQAALAYMSAMTGLDQTELQARLQQEQIQAGSYQPGMIGTLLGSAGSTMSGIGAMGAAGGGGAGAAGAGAGGANMGVAMMGA